MVIVFRAVPTTSGFCTISFMPAARAMLSSRVLPATARAAAERWSASPMPAELIAKLFKFVTIILRKHKIYYNNITGRRFLPASCAYLAYTQVRTGSSPVDKTGECGGATVTSHTITVSTDSQCSIFFLCHLTLRLSSVSQIKPTLL